MEATRQYQLKFKTHILEKMLAAENTLDYYNTVLITMVKCFIEVINIPKMI
jgi:hypothetical protein